MTLYLTIIFIIVLLLSIAYYLRFRQTTKKILASTDTRTEGEKAIDEIIAEMDEKEPTAARGGY